MKHFFVSCLKLSPNPHPATDTTPKPTPQSAYTSVLLFSSPPLSHITPPKQSISFRPNNTQNPPPPALFVFRPIPPTRYSTYRAFDESALKDAMQPQQRPATTSHCMHGARKAAAVKTASFSILDVLSEKLGTTGVNGGVGVGDIPTNTTTTTNRNADASPNHRHAAQTTVTATTPATTTTTRHTSHRSQARCANQPQCKLPPPLYGDGCRRTQLRSVCNQLEPDGFFGQETVCYQIGSNQDEYDATFSNGHI